MQSTINTNPDLTAMATYSSFCIKLTHNSKQINIACAIFSSQIELKTFRFCSPEFAKLATERRNFIGEIF